MAFRNLGSSSGIHVLRHIRQGPSKPANPCWIDEAVKQNGGTMLLDLHSICRLELRWELGGQLCGCSKGIIIRPSGMPGSTSTASEQEEQDEAAVLRFFAVQLSNTVTRCDARTLETGFSSASSCAKLMRGGILEREPRAGSSCGDSNGTDGLRWEPSCKKLLARGAVMVEFCEETWRAGSWFIFMRLRILSSLAATALRSAVRCVRNCLLPAVFSYGIWW
jgi:hypothetical protein